MLRRPPLTTKSGRLRTTAGREVPLSLAGYLSSVISNGMGSLTEFTEQLERCQPQLLFRCIRDRDDGAQDRHGHGIAGLEQSRPGVLDQHPDQSQALLLFQVAASIAGEGSVTDIRGIRSAHEGSGQGRSTYLTRKYSR